MISLPEEYQSGMRELLGSQYEAYMAELDKEPYSGVRFNLRKFSDRDVKALESFVGATLERVPWCPTGFYVPYDSRPSQFYGYEAGLYYIQEPSAMVSAELLPVDKSHKVLDLCAAPGGKATRLAEKAGVLLANDISASRAGVMVGNVERAGLCNTAVSAEAPEKLADLLGAAFDRILVDAPCSGEGMFRKDPSLVSSWLERQPEYYHGLQIQILDAAYRLLKKGGLILYSTCTFSELEDELTLEAFLEAHPDMSLEELPLNWGFEKGRRSLHQARRLYPHRLKGEGHFLALLKKAGDPETAPDRDEAFGGSVSGLSGLERRRIGDRLYLFPQEAGRLFGTKGIRFLRTGLLAGEYRKNGSFRPSSALALAAGKEDIRDGTLLLETEPGREKLNAGVLDLDMDDERVARYLKGETIEVEDTLKGLCLLCCQGHPLGFGRCSLGRMKNDRGR